MNLLTSFLCVFTGCAPPLYSGVYVSGHFNDLAAVAFLPPRQKERQIRRIMMQSAATFNHQVTAQQYIDLYEKMLRWPLVNRQNTDAFEINKISSKEEHHKPAVEELMSDSIPLEGIDEQNIIRFPKRKWDVEKQQPKIHRVNK